MSTLHIVFQCSDSVGLCVLTVRLSGAEVGGVTEMPVFFAFQMNHSSVRIRFSLFIF